MQKLEYSTGYAEHI